MAGPTKHNLLTRHRSVDPTTGAAIAVDKVPVTDGAGGFTWEDYGGGSVNEVVAHGNAGTTETFTFAPTGTPEGAPTAGSVHTGTLNADLTATFAGAVSGEEAAMTLVLTQDGTGGWDVTWPAAVEWPDGVTPTLDTTAGSVEILSFLSTDGGTTWYGFHGGSGGSALTVEDEGTPLATAATTLDFVGAGVTASGTGAEKTITIPGVTAAAVAAVGAVGEILISDSPSTPLVFADLIQNEAEDDLVYADLA